MSETQTGGPGNVTLTPDTARVRRAAQRAREAAELLSQAAAGPGLPEWRAGLWRSLAAELRARSECLFVQADHADADHGEPGVAG